MSRRSLSLFLFVGLLWGIPYMFMKIAIDTFTPSVIVFGRVIIGAALLIPIALKQGGVREIIKGWKYVVPYAAAEMIGPWYLISSAEKDISSGLAGLLVATVPIWATIFASVNGDKTVWHSTRLFGLVFGFAGLVALVGIESITGNSSLTSIFMVLLASILYAYAVNMITKKLPGVSGIALNGVAMGISAVFFAPFAYVQWPQTAIPMNAIWSVIGLGVLCTALAFVLFFKVMADIGPARASLVTYINTAFAVLLGVIILSEPITLGIMVGLPMVLVGSYFASRKPTVNV
ncbi:EamA-like transporter family protein [Candidatus Planktophila limnetica]|uniref:EamA-like transporter family protein n=1 Tax=Candidatus Planktophila limnetica TaxID=573600 RepID=A0A249LFT0_9ACTN|nr:DMT family transporter [Candidatus Planktophila limnetica]ASY27857.1 EamA-like transporter family protein [Candidatus Planktophila limnetica]